MGATTVVPFVNKEMTVTNPSVIHFSVWKNEKNKKKTLTRLGTRSGFSLFIFFSSADYFPRVTGPADA